MHKNGKTEHRGGRQYGYVRVSSREQNEARQLAAMCNAGIRAEYIFADKQSGRNFDRPQYKKLLRSTIYTLVIVAAISVLVATLLLPVLQIYGTSMNPNLQEGEIVVSVKSPQFKTGDIIAFYYNNRVLVKRIIGCPGDSVVITDSGDVYVNNTLLDEPYLTEKSYGTADIEYPYTVPQNSFFVLGDHRESSVDSRSSLVGCVEKEEIIGKIVFRVWPIKRIGSVD